jgi:hypothetical protein
MPSRVNSRQVFVSSSLARREPLWQQPVHLGRPIQPNGTEIDLFGINILWGILSTPAIDLATGTMYVVCRTSLDGTVASAVHQLHALNISDGRPFIRQLVFVFNNLR